MAVNRVGVNLIQVETDTAPTVQPVEVGVLGVCGKFYRGSRLVEIRGTGQDALSQIYKRLGTPYENFRNSAYYNVIGHVQNSGAFGSVIFASRLRPSNARVARTYRNPNLPPEQLEDESNWNESKTVMRLNRRRDVSNLLPSSLRITHSYTPSSNIYRIRIAGEILTNAPSIPYYYRAYPSRIYISSTPATINFSSNTPSLRISVLGQFYTFTASPESIRTGNTLELTLSGVPSPFNFLSNSISPSNNPFENIILEEDRGEGYTVNTNVRIHVTGITLLPDIIILDSGSGFVSPVTATFSHPLPQNVQIQVAVGTGGAISQLQFINTSTSQPANVPILSSSLEDPISTFPTISFLQNRFMIEEYQDSSLQRIANCINNGQPIDQKRVVISPDDSTSTTTGDVDVTNEFLSRPSQLVFVDLVTQALELPIATATNALFQETYQIQTTGKLGRFYFQAGQNNEPDWGAWGNLLSIKISESPIDPSFRKVQIFYKQEGEKKIVEEFEDSEQNVLSALKNSFYVQLVLHPTNTMNFLPFLPGVELFFYNGFDGTPQFQDYLGNPQQETGAYAFLGTPVTSMTCPDATDGFSNLTQQQILTIIDLYASLALSNNKTAIFALPRNISRNDIFNIYTRNFLKDRSNLILYRANGSVPDGRGGFINVPLVGHIHGAAYVRWRLSRSLFPNTIPKGDPTFLVGVFGLDKERYSQDEINDYVRNLGVNPVVLSSAGFIVEGARTMSRKNVHYSIHATELTNFYVESLIRFASFLKSEFNDETTQNRFAQRITDFTRILYDANCLDTEGGFNNNFQIKVDSSINPTSSRRKRIFNARIKIRWIEQIEAINIFFEKTDEGVSAQVG